MFRPPKAFELGNSARRAGWSCGAGTEHCEMPSGSLARIELTSRFIGRRLAGDALPTIFFARVRFAEVTRRVNRLAAAKIGDGGRHAVAEEAARAAASTRGAVAAPALFGWSTPEPLPRPLSHGVVRIGGHGDS